MIVSEAIGPILKRLGLRFQILGAIAGENFGGLRRCRAFELINVTNATFPIKENVRLAGRGNLHRPCVVPPSLVVFGEMPAVNFCCIPAKGGEFCRENFGGFFMI